MDITSIKAFVIVAEELNFRIAADRLHVTQPPLTRMIAKLEADLGVKLFDRTTRKVSLTGAGVAFLNESKEVIEKFDALERNIKAIGKLKSGVIRIGLSHFSLHTRIPYLIETFKEAFKGINVELIPMTNVDQIKNLKKGSIDLGFSEVKVKDPIYQQIEIEKRELGFLVHKNSRLAKLRSIALQDLHQETIIYHSKSENLGFQEEFRDFLERMKIYPTFYYKRPKEGCANLVFEEKGILLSVKESPRLPDIVWRPMSDFKANVKLYGLSIKDNPSLALKSFRSFLEESSLIPEREGSHLCSYSH